MTREPVVVVPLRWYGDDNNLLACRCVVADLPGWLPWKLHGKDAHPMLHAPDIATFRFPNGKPRVKFGSPCILFPTGA